MKIAIIGAGFTGLSAAYELGKLGHKVTVFEKESHVGGLAVGFRPPIHKGRNSWKWPLEIFYHHFFTSDRDLLTLSQELGMTKDCLVLRPITATLCPKKKNDTNYPIFQLDSPLHLLTFPRLSLFAKLRTAALLGFCKLNPFWQPLEHITAKTFFRTIGGNEAWDVLWEPLMRGKFSVYSDRIPASWLWARFHTRTTHLGYFRGGFQAFAETLARSVRAQGGKIELETPIPKIKRVTGKNKFIIDNTVFDRVLITTPSPVATKLFRFPKAYTTQLQSVDHLYAQVLIIETKKPLLDTTYWLNINDRSFPFLAVVQHTNMIDKKYYGGHHITYIGNYLPEGHPYLSLTKQQLIKKFTPYLKRINSSFLSSSRLIVSSSLFSVPFAQPVHTLAYSTKAPGITTPVPNCFIANLDSIYPWDRGTNYAVKLGKKAAEIIRNSPACRQGR